MKEILFPVFMSASALSPGCSENTLMAVEEVTDTGVGEATPLPSASASGEMFLEACGPVSTTLAPLYKSDSEPETKSFTAIDTYNSAFAEAVNAELEKMSATELLDGKVPLTVGFYSNNGDDGRAISVDMRVAIGDLSGAWQNWLDSGGGSAREFFHYSDEIERFIECRISTTETLTPALYDWNADIYGDSLLYFNSSIYQQGDNSSALDMIDAVSVQYVTRVIASDDSELIGDNHYVTNFSSDLLISHGVEEVDVDCNFETTCGHSEDFVSAEELVLATTHQTIASQMDYMTILAGANILPGEDQALVVTQIDIGDF